MGELVKRENKGIIISKNGTVSIPSDIPISSMNRELFLSTVNYPKIKLIEDKNKVVKTIHSYINTTIMDKGANIPSDEISFMTARITDDIMKDFSSYSLEEIRLAFHYGVRGELGDYFGINPTTFYTWLKRFRYDLIPPINKSIQPLLPKLDSVIKSQDEVDKTTRELIYEVYLKLSINGEYDFYDVGNVVYKYLEKIGLIPYSNEEKMNFIYKSREHFRRTISNKNRDLERQGKKFHKIDVKRAFEQIEQASNPTFQYQIKVGAMRLALFDLLTRFASEDVDIKKLIKNKINNKKD